MRRYGWRISRFGLTVPVFSFSFFFAVSCVCGFRCCLLCCLRSCFVRAFLRGITRALARQFMCDFARGWLARGSLSLTATPTARVLLFSLIRLRRSNGLVNVRLFRFLRYVDRRARRCPCLLGHGLARAFSENA